MASILIRCTGGTDIPTDALAGWLERQRPRIEHEPGVTALRLAAVDHVDDAGERPAGWLVEVDVADRRVADAGVVVAEVLGDMRLLGLRPTVFVPYALATAQSPDVEAGSYATPVYSSSA